MYVSCTVSAMLDNFNLVFQLFSESSFDVSSSMWNSAQLQCIGNWPSAIDRTLLLNMRLREPGVPEVSAYGIILLLIFFSAPQGLIDALTAHIGPVRVLMDFIYCSRSETWEYWHFF